MALSIKNDEVEGLARELSRETGESITQVILHALQQQAQQLRAGRSEAWALARLMRASRACSSLPDRDARSPDEILGYGADGTFD
jgi:antitoxin VapB